MTASFQPCGRCAPRWVQVDRTRILFKALAPEGGASGMLARCSVQPCTGCLHIQAAVWGRSLHALAPSHPSLFVTDVGQSIVHYAQENDMGLVVMGARGMGSFKR